jgi:adhesin transport system membrane fusion protein
MSETVEVRLPLDQAADPDHGPHALVWQLVAAITGLLLAVLAWAVLAQLDVTVQSRGAVVPASHLQEVQSLEGGIVEQVMVKPGDVVRKGQLLALLDRAAYAAPTGENQQHWLAAMAAKARLDALISGGPPRFDPEWSKQAPDLLAHEMQVWREALAENQAGLAAAQQAVARKQAELAEAQARVPAQQAALRLAQESLAIEERLHQAQAGAYADLLNARQRVLQVQSELDALRQSMPRLQAGLAEAQAGLAEVPAKARAQWGAQRSELQTKAAALRSTLGGLQDRLDRRQLTAPMDGVVNRVLVNTQGGVVAPGKPVMEIVPHEARLILHARIKPADIGFVRSGQRAQVQVLAYDASTYGRIQGQVDRVSADAIADEKGEPYFEVQISAAAGQLKAHGQALPITPGMPADIGILTGQRSVAQYLLKPVLKSLQAALQER